MRGFSPLKIIYWGLLIMGLYVLPVAAQVDRLIIRYNQNPELLPYEMTKVFGYDDRGQRKIVNRPFQVYRANHGDTSTALFIRANNGALGRDENASFALIRLNPVEYISEDPIFFTIWDYNIYFDREYQSQCIAASGYRNDSAFVIRHRLQTREFEYIFLCTGKDHTGNDQWETAVNFLGAFDYDFDGRIEQFFQTFPGRDIEPRTLFCVEMETHRVEWSLPVAPVIISLADCRDTLNPSVIFATYGTQNNVVQGRFIDNYGYLSKINSKGILEFNYIINADFGGTQVIPVDTAHNRFCIYHTLPFLPDTFNDTLPARRPTLAIIDRKGNSIHEVTTGENMASGWRDKYRNHENAIFLISNNGVIQIYDTTLNLLAESNPTNLRGYNGKIKVAGLADSQYVIGGMNGLNIYSRDFRQLGSLPYRGGAVEPIVFDSTGNVRTLLVSDPNQGFIVNINGRPLGEYAATIFWYYRNLIVIALFLLLVALLIINYMRGRVGRTLRGSEARRRALMYATPDLIFTLDAEGKFLDFEGVDTERFFIPPNQIIGRNIRDILPPETVKKALESIENVLKTGQINSFEYQLIMPDGRKDYEARFIISAPDEVLAIVRDISEWRQAEAALRESEEQYRTLVETAGESIFTVNYDGTFLFLNTVAAHRLGGEPQDFIGKSMWDLFPKDIADIQMANVQDAIKSGQRKSDESLIYLQGRPYWFNTSLRALKNSSGAYYAVIAIASDVSAIHRANLELKGERDFSSSILDTANSLIVCLDERARITIFNRECERVTGYSREEVLGKNWPNLFLPEESRHKGLINFAEWVKIHPEDRKQESLVTKSGELRTILWSNSVLYSEDGRMTAIAIGQDMTERLEADRAFQESEEKMHAIFESAANGITILDLNLDIVEVNPASIKMFGYEKKAEVIGKNILSYLPPVQHSTVPNLKQTVLKRGTLTNIEFMAINRNGREFPISVSASSLHDSQGMVVGFVVIVDDISIRKREEIRDRSRLQLLSELRTAMNVEQCLTLGCNAIYNSGLYKRAVLTIHNEKREIIHLGQIGLDPIIIERARKAPAPSREIAARMTQEKYRISHSYFIPEDAAIMPLASGRVIVQKEKGGSAPSDWKPGDELFVPIIGSQGQYEGWLSVDTPFDGRRPTHDVINCMEEIVDIVTKRVHTVQSLVRLDEERQALARANIALAKSEANYRDLIDAAYDIIFTVNREGKFLALNPAFEKGTGWKIEEWLGRSSFEIIHPEDLERAQETFAKVLGGYSAGTHEYRIITKSGQYIIGEFMTSPHYQDDKVIGIFGIARDITERRRMEHELRVSEEKFRNLAEHSLQGMMVFQDELVAFVNSRFAEIHEVTVQEILGKSDFDIIKRFLHPEFKEEAMKRLKSRLAGEELSSNQEFRIITARGKVRWIEAFVQKMNFDGRPAIQMVIIDITDRKRAEGALRKSEEAYRDLVENVNDVLFSIDDKGIVTYVSPAIKSILGYDSLAMAGRPVWPYIYNDDLPEIRKSLGDVLEGILYPSEYRMIAKSGEAKWVRSSSRPVFEGDKVVGIRGVLVDIDQRRRMEEALAESEHKFRNLAEHSLQGMFVYQGDKYLFVNSRATEIIGYSSEEILSYRVSDFLQKIIHPDHIKQVQQYAGQTGHETGGSIHYEIKIITKKREERWVELYSQAMTLEGKQTRQVVVIDITERKAAEAALKYRQAFEDLITSISTRFIDLAPHEVEAGLKAAVNEIGEFVGTDLVYLFNISAERNTLSFLYRWWAPDYPGEIDPNTEYPLDMLGWTMQLLRAQKNIYIPSLSNLPPEAKGDRRLLQSLNIKTLLTVPMIYRRNLIGGLGVASMTAERTFSEDIIALMRIVGEIFANTIERQRAEIQIQKTNLEKYMQARQIAGGMAHEIRNALFPVRGALSLMRRAWNESTPKEEDLMNYSRIADDAISRALDITGLISQYTKLDTEKFPGQVDPCEVIKEVLKSNQLRIKDQNVKVEINCPDGIIVESNRRQLFIAINNIFINAMDALTNRPDPSIIIEGKRIQELFNLIIADNGEGIAAEPIDKIFELFYSTKPNKGTGMGLASTKGIVEMYGGTIKVESKINKGTRFTVTLKIFGGTNNG